MIDYRHLRHFVEVAELLHVTEAAKRLHIAQPALSQSIRTLERNLDVKLFLRKNKRMALTDAGRAFLAEARKSIDQFEYAKAIARSAERGVVGKFSIGFGPTAGLGILPAILRKFRGLYPDVELVLREVGTEGQLQGVERRELDVAIGYTRADEAKFSSRVLRTEELVVLLPREHPLAANETLAVRQIAGEPLILPRRSAAASVANAISALYSSQNLSPRFAHQVETPQAAHALVAAGLEEFRLPHRARSSWRTRWWKDVRCGTSMHRWNWLCSGAKAMSLRCSQTSWLNCPFPQVANGKEAQTEAHPGSIPREPRSAFETRP